MRIKRTAVVLGATGTLALSTLVPMSAQAAEPAAATVQEKAAASRSCPKLVAHRGGGSPDVGENSMRAFRNAIRRGVWAIETDVHYTKDKVAIIMHDDTLDRTTNGTGKVRDKTYAQISKLRLNNGQRIPTMAKVLKLAERKNVAALFEYKDVEKASYFKRYLKELQSSDARAWVAGFSDKLMDYAAQHDPDRKRMWFHLGFGLDPSAPPKGVAAGLLNIALTPDVVKNLKSNGHRVGAWFNVAVPQDNPAGWETAAKTGVTWITTDNPKQYQEWQASNPSCVGRPLRPQKAKCAIYPRHLKNNALTVLLKRKCLTTANRRVVVEVKAKKSVAKLVRGKNGKRSVMTYNRRGKVKIIYRAKATKYYQGFKKVKRYQLSDGGRG